MSRTSVRKSMPAMVKGKDLSTAFSVHFLCYIKLRESKSKCIDLSSKMSEMREMRIFCKACSQR